MVNVTQQSSNAALLPHSHFNLHSVGEKRFVLTILQQNGKSLARPMSLPLSDNSTDHLTTNAISPVIWTSADKCCILAKVLWHNYGLIDSSPCVSLSGLTWDPFRYVFEADKHAHCYLKISFRARVAINLLQRSLSPPAKDPNRRFAFAFKPIPTPESLLKYVFCKTNSSKGCRLLSHHRASRHRRVSFGCFQQTFSRFYDGWSIKTMAPYPGCFDIP